MRPTTPPPPRRRRAWAVAICVAAAIALSVPGQAVLALDPVAQDQVLELEDRLAETSATNAELVAENAALEDQVAALSEENLALETTSASLEQENERLALERDRLLASVEHFTGLFDALEADRQLLVALRKDLPADSRPEAEAHIERIRRLALASNPSVLGQLAVRVAETAPAYLDWRFTEHPTPEAATQAYIESRANAFDTTMNALRSAILLSVANRLDGMLNILDRIR